MDSGWSLDELAERVAQALAADGVRAPNGRVRDVPDGRAIRWYATIGLVDRPLAGGRRAGRYTARHLLQVVAVKRRQAAGRSLAEIQAELAGASDAVLRAVARVPEALLAAAPPDRRPVRRERFWATPVPALARETGAGSGAGARPRAGAHAGAEPRGAGHGGRDPGAATRAASASAPAPPQPALVRYLVALAGGVTLSLPAAPSAADLAAIQDAAAPLLHLLTDRGLTATKESDDDPPAH